MVILAVGCVPNPKSGEDKLELSRNAYKVDLTQTTS